MIRTKSSVQVSVINTYSVLERLIGSSAATIKSTRLAIAEEEAQELAAGTLPPHDVSPGVFLQLGLEIEEQQ